MCNFYYVPNYPKTVYKLKMETTAHVSRCNIVLELIERVFQSFFTEQWL